MKGLRKHCYPKEVFAGVYSPGRRLVEFAIEKKNVTGGFSEDL